MSIPEIPKKTCDAVQIEITRTLTLNDSLWRVFSPGISQSDMISASRAAVTAPTEGPNQRVAAKTNGSETESRATSPGILTVNDPVKIVSVASAHQDEFGGCKKRSVSAHSKHRSADPWHCGQVCLPETRPRLYGRHCYSGTGPSLGPLRLLAPNDKRLHVCPPPKLLRKCVNKCARQNLAGQASCPR